ncbi:hypothetical protein WJX84_007265 [Apatococcus fuscideae]|uniref:Uncharacterized protein n=1 Tax=Apatococcus fuscideae TaxID=2026836 RepID=A0AAW1TM65_9CHLO
MPTQDIGAKFSQPVQSEKPVQSMADMQKWVQARQTEKGFVHLIGKHDRITSVIVPCAFAAIGAALLARGLHNLYTGQGRAE